MMTRQVQLSEDAYARLAALKRPGESFSDVVLRVAPKPDLVEVLGRLRRTPGEIEAHYRLLDEMNSLDMPPQPRKRRRRR
jgi:predicted CopG family antitoxin